MAAKIFGIGLSRTGTSTLINALVMLGYSAVHFPHRPSDFYDNDAAADTPVATRFEQLDELMNRRNGRSVPPESPKKV